MAQKQIKEIYSVTIHSRTGDNPANFTSNLTFPIRLDKDKQYKISLHNAILSASWSTAPTGTAFTFNGSPVTIPAGHYNFDSLKDILSSYMTIEPITTTGRCKITVPSGTIVMGTLAASLGFVEGNILGVGDHIGSFTIAINPVNFINVLCNLVDFNSTRSNINTRPILRTSTLPPCITPFQYFDLCRDTDDYSVKCNNSEISTVEINVTDDNGVTLGLDKDIPTYFTFSIFEI